MIKEFGYPWPEKLHIITIKESILYTNNEDITHSWCDLLRTDTSVGVHVALEYDTVDRWRWLGHLKLFDMGASAPFEVRRMLMTDRRYCVRDGGPFPVRIIWASSKGNAGFFVRGDSKIKTPRDIKPGARITRMTKAGSQKIVDGLLAWAGVNHGDIIWVEVGNWEENCRAVVEGRADLAFGLPTSPAVHESEKSLKGLNWVDLNSAVDPEGARRFWEVEPLFSFGPVHSGVASAIGHWGTVGISFEVTRADLDPELVYNLARWFDTNYERFKDKHPSNRFRNRETLVEGLRHTFIPCHEGLVAYLKDVGLWTSAHDLRQHQNRTLVDRYAAAYQDCMRQADDQHIWVARENDAWVNFWTDYRQANLPGFKLFEDLPG